MKPLHREIIVFVGVLLLVLAILWEVVGYEPDKSCTIFTAVQGDTVLYGNSEDQHNPNPVLGFYPASAAGFGSVHFGVRSSDGQVNFEGAVNDQGLAWDVNSTPRFKLTPHREKPYWLGAENYLTTITKKAASVEEAIRMAGEFDFGGAMEGQIHIADASGDAVVISAGSDRGIAFTRKPTGEGYLLSTNFNLAQPERGPVDWRWDAARTRLDALRSEKPLTPAYARSILEAVHLKTLTSYTLYSNVIDLKNRTVYLHYMSQFVEVAEIDMLEELAQGQRVVEMREFFSPSTAAAGDAAYQRFATRFRLAKVGVVAAGSMLVVGLTTLVVRRLWNRREKGKSPLWVSGVS
ncbi:MAG: hypothetical protein R6X31_13870 [Anaerolineae bacterium]